MGDILKRLASVSLNSNVQVLQIPFGEFSWPSRPGGIFVIASLSASFDYGLNGVERVIIIISKLRKRYFRKCLVTDELPKLWML
jgi:hypothetical protein